MPFAATWMDLEITILSEVRNRKTNTIWYHLMWNLKYNTNELIYRTETDSQTQSTDLRLSRGRGWGKEGLRVRACACAWSLSRVRLCDPMGCSPPGSSVCGVLQAGTLEWVAASSSGGLSNPGIRLRSPALQADSLPSEPLVYIEG